MKKSDLIDSTAFIDQKYLHSVKSFVIPSTTNKSKVSTDYIKGLLDVNADPNRESKLELIELFHASRVDFRTLNQLRH